MSLVPILVLAGVVWVTWEFGILGGLAALIAAVVYLGYLR